MATTLPVKINLATAGEIAELYDVGPKLAQRIVTYREAHGYFHGPEELDAVDGISADLAITLAPHIDWQIPEDLPKKIERDYFFFSLLVLAIIASVYLMYFRRIPDLSFHLNNYFSGAPGGLVWVFIQVCLLSYHIFIDLVGVGWAIVAITINSQLKIRARKFSIASLILALVSLILVAIFNAIYYQFFSPTGWGEFLLGGVNLAATVFALGFGLCVSVIVLALWKPFLISKYWFQRVFDVGLLLIGIALVRLVSGAKVAPLYFNN